MSADENGTGRPKTKIVCTLGPSTEGSEQVSALIEAGMSIARLNLSHGSLESHALAIQTVRREAARLGEPVGIMVDVPGPKYRTGELSTGVVELEVGNEITLTSRDVVGDSEIVSVSPPGIHRDASVGGSVLIDDGLIALEVVTIDGEHVRCRVAAGGRMTEQRGVTTPGRAPSQPFHGEQTRAALEFAAEQDADFVALSVVTEEENVTSARERLRELGREPEIISKIERSEAVDSMDSILEASDALMVARGDLGVDVPIEKVPSIQKELIRKCNAVGKPVITATQMLESMVQSPVPTRAEVTDVANAVFDGTDAIMLSGETSIGRYPVEAVELMARVAIEAESVLAYESIIMEKALELVEQTDDAISYDACRTAHQLKAKAIVAFTESGSTAGRVSKYRPQPPILAITPNERIQRRLVLRWGVTPLTVDRLDSVDDFFEVGERQAIETVGVGPGDLVVLVAGLPIGVSGGTNLLRVLTIGQSAGR